MGLFSKKTCDICGEKIGLIGNRKLEDGNLCKDCAKKLSPWFSERRHSTLSDIRQQLVYREENKKAVAAFHPTLILGDHTRFMVDQDARKFLVLTGKDLAAENPDVLDFSQARGCDLDIDEHRTEKEDNGHTTYEFSYNFYVTIHVDHPYFDEMRFRLNNSAINTGSRAMGSPGNWVINSKIGNFLLDARVKEYNECARIGNEIKETVNLMRLG